MLAFLLKEKLYLFEHPRVFIPFLSRAYKKIHFFDLREEKNWKKKRRSRPLIKLVARSRTAQIIGRETTTSKKEKSYSRKEQRRLSFAHKAPAAARFGVIFGSRDLLIGGLRPRPFGQTRSTYGILDARRAGAADSLRGHRR